MRYRTAQQLSSGGVIVRRRQGRPEVCLIGRRTEAGMIWGLPKGHVEPGEDAASTAIREVREETGLQGEIVEPLGSITYWVAAPGECTRSFKRVHFFLMRYVAGDTAEHEQDIDEAAWVTWDEARARLTYPSERRMLRKAQRHLNKVAK